MQHDMPLVFYCRINSNQSRSGLIAAFTAALLQVMALIGHGQDARVGDLQKKLVAAGFDPKSIDGIWGPGTEAALRAYEAAASNPAEIDYNRGVANWLGTGVKQDTQAALTWWRKAAEQGSVAAQYNLGACQLNGSGVLKDEASGAALITAAAEKGNAWAERVLGELHEKGLGVARDEQKAVEWLRRAAEHGDPDAQYRMGLRLWQKSDDDKGKAEARRLIAEAASRGSVDAFLAQVNLAAGLVPACYIEINADPGPEGTMQLIELQKKSAQKFREEQRHSLEDQRPLGVDKETWDKQIAAMLDLSPGMSKEPRFQLGSKTDEALWPFKIGLISEGNVRLEPENIASGEQIVGPCRIAFGSTGKFAKKARVGVRFDRESDYKSGIVEGHVTCTVSGQVHVVIRSNGSWDDAVPMQGFQLLEKQESKIDPTTNVTAAAEEAPKKTSVPMAVKKMKFAPTAKIPCRLLMYPNGIFGANEAGYWHVRGMNGEGQLAPGSEIVIMGGPCDFGDDFGTVHSERSFPILVVNKEDEGALFVAGRGKIMARDGSVKELGSEFDFGKAVALSASADKLERKAGIWTLMWLAHSPVEKASAEAIFLKLLRSNKEDEFNRIILIQGLGKVGGAASLKELKAIKDDSGEIGRVVEDSIKKLSTGQRPS